MVEGFLAAATAPVPCTDWTQELADSRLTYTGEVVAKAAPLTWRQFEPALPPQHLSGRLDPLSVAAPPLAELLANPALSPKPDSEWPHPIRNARVHVHPDDEWALIVRRLIDYNIFDVADIAEACTANGRPVLNGAFGVGKGKSVPGTESDSSPLEVQRLIINLHPTNQLQRQIKGDVPLLPYFGQWLGIELLDQEILLWSGQDLRCSFYVWALPPAWRPYFMLSKPVRGSAIGRPEREWHWPVVRVLPMGWISAVGVMQHLHRKLMITPPPPGRWAPAAGRNQKGPPSDTGRPRPVTLVLSVVH